MDTNNINISVLEQAYSTLESEKFNFKNTTFSTFKSSYIYNCNDDLIRKLKENLETCYKHIDDEYTTITKWFEYYLDDVKSVEQGIINGLNYISTHESAINVYYSTYLLPLTLDYDKIHSTVELSTVNFGVFSNNYSGINSKYFSNPIIVSSNTFPKGYNGINSKYFNELTSNVAMYNSESLQPIDTNTTTILEEIDYVTNDDLMDKTLATIGVSFVSLWEGLAKAGEALLDVSAIYGTSQYLYNTEGLTVEQQFARHEEAEAMWENAMNFVKEDFVGNAFNEFYSTDGEWLKDNAYYFDVVRAVGNGVGEVGAIVGLSFFGVPAPFVAGMNGFGKGSETAWQNGASLEEGLLTGAATGTVDAVSYWAGGKINNFSPFKNDALNSLCRVTLDGLDGGTNSLLQTGVSLIYQDGYTDSNGQYHAYSDDFLTAYGEAFEAQGGWTNVGTNAAFGAGMSFIGEASGIAKHFRDHLEGKVNVDSDVNLNKNTINNIKNLLIDEYKVKFDGFVSYLDNKKNNVLSGVKEKFDSFSSKFDDIKNAKDINIKNNTDTGKVYFNDAIDDASISAANDSTRKGLTREFRFKDADSMPDRNHPFWRDIQNSDKILINVGGRLMSFDDAISYKMNYDLNKIPETILDNNANDLKKEILSKISSDMSPLEQARKLYIELNSRIHYSMDWIKGDVSTKTSIYNQSISFDTLTSNDVICKGWSELYHELLISAGFDSNAVKIMGGSAVGAHKWIEVDLGNGQILVADATDVISHSIDLSNCKGGFKTNGFVLLDSTYSGIKLKQLSSEYLEWNNNNIMDIDLILGYATDNGYYSDIIKKSQSIFSDNEVVKKIFGSKIFEQKLKSFTNTEIPVGMDGYEAYAYFNKIKHLLFDETELKQIKVSLLFNKTDAKIEGVTMVSSIGDYSSYIIYSESLGKVTFCDLNDANDFLRRLNLVN